MNFFITATDTNVGKSYIGANLAKELASLGKKVGYLKPFQSGTIDDIDENFVKKIAPNADTKSTYITKTPCTPYISAILDNVEIKMEKVKNDFAELSQKNDITIVEGSGGILVPVYKNILVADVIKELDLPTLIIARPDLGTINHTLLTIEAAKNRGLEIVGIVISNYPKETSDVAILKAKDMIEEFSNVKVIAQIEQGQSDLSELARMLI